jgi:hypothetical protein
LASASRRAADPVTASGRCPPLTPGARARGGARTACHPRLARLALALPRLVPPISWCSIACGVPPWGENKSRRNAPNTLGSGPSIGRYSSEPSDCGRIPPLLGVIVLMAGIHAGGAAAGPGWTVLGGSGRPQPSLSGSSSQPHAARTCQSRSHDTLRCRTCLSPPQPRVRPRRESAQPGFPQRRPLTARPAASTMPNWSLPGWASAGRRMLIGQRQLDGGVPLNKLADHPQDAALVIGAHQIHALLLPPVQLDQTALVIAEERPFA